MKISLTALLLLLVPGLILTAGCERSSVETVPVEGKVTFGGQECPAGGVIYFLPTSVAAGLPNRPASATFEKDGHFRVTSFKQGDGLVPGTYSVRIECWRQGPTEMAKGISYVPADYHPADVTVARAARGPISLTFDVPRRAG